jgi:ATP-dependent Clp protease ATP-binding subunit ClpA
LELALREALSLGDNFIGTEHILLGLVRENEGVGARILLDFDADAEKICNELLRLMSRETGRSHGGRRPGSSCTAQLRRPGRIDRHPDSSRPLCRRARGYADMSPLWDRLATQLPRGVEDARG